MDSRRSFVGGVAAAAFGAVASTPAGLPRRPLGKTGLQVSVIGLGGARIGSLPDEAPAIGVVKRCFDEGINYFDTAAAGAYGLSQKRYGLALRGLRDRIVLATKTRNRSATQAELDLNQSLSNLRTDHIDLYQLHNIINQEDIDFAFGPRGVMEMVEKARKAGKIRFVGVTGHTTPAVINKILGMYDFASVLIPLSVSDGANRQKSFEKETIPVARSRGAAIIAMKVLGVGRLIEGGKATVEECLSYTLSLPIATAILGCDQVEQVIADARIARSAKPLSAAAMEKLRQRFSPLELARMEPWKQGMRDPQLPGAYLAD